MADSYGDQPISAVIELTENAEDIFEDVGIDYWFGADKTLREACEAKRIDPSAVESRLIRRATKRIPKDRAATIEELDHHFDTAIRPALQRVLDEARDLRDHQDLSRRIASIEEGLSRHREIIHRPALRDGVTPDRETLRQLALQHSM